MSDTPIAPELIEANKAKLLAEAEAALSLARKNDAEARKADAEAANSEAFAINQRMQNEVGAIARDEMLMKRKRELAQDFYHHVYRFTEGVAASSVRKCIDQLVWWQREALDIPEDQKPPIEIEFFSPGGGVIEGMALFDTIQSLRTSGHHVTTSATGYAASMGGILLQAGDTRLIGREAYVLIHEVSFGAGGKIGEVEDEVKFVKKIQSRVLDIFAARSAAAHKANPKVCTAPMTKRQFQAAWNRKDWWLSSDECLKHGVVDGVR